MSQDFTQAAYWFRKSAEQGNAEAQFDLGILFHNGQGVKWDSAEGDDWLRKAEEQGYCDGKVRIGGLSTIGPCVLSRDARELMLHHQHP